MFSHPIKNDAHILHEGLMQLYGVVLHLVCCLKSIAGPQAGVTIGMQSMELQLCFKLMMVIHYQGFLLQICPPQKEQILELTLSQLQVKLHVRSMNVNHGCMKNVL